MRTIKLLAVLGLLAGNAAMAAGTASGTVNISAIIAASCNIASQPTGLSFGNYNVFGTTALTATSTFSVQCVKGTVYTMKLSGGNASGVRTFTTAPAGSTLNYSLSYNGTPWGDGASGHAAAVTVTAGDTSTATYTISGSIAAGQTNAAAGSYSDTINLSVDY